MKCLYSTVIIVIEIIIIKIINPSLPHDELPRIYLYIYPLTIKKTHKQESKQNVFNLQPFRTSRNLAQHLQVNLIRIHLTPPHTVTSRFTSFISELNHSAYFIAEPYLDITSWNLKLPNHKFRNTCPNSKFPRTANPYPALTQFTTKKL